MAESPQAEILHFLYVFQFPDKTEKRFEVNLDPATLALIPWNLRKADQFDPRPGQDFFA